MTEKEIIKDELTSMVERIKSNLDLTLTTASGKTKDSFRVDSTDFGVAVFVRKYFKGVEIGRGPGGVPKGFNEIIKQWIIDKGVSVKQIPYKRKPSNKWQPKYGVPERSLNMASSAIAHTIKTTGTKLHKEGGRNDVYSEEIKKTVDLIKERLKSEIISQIKLNYK